MNRLKYLRTEKNEGLDKVAKYLNVTVQTISNYENEKRDMSPETIIKLAEYYNVSTDYLLGKSDIRTPIDINNIHFANNGGIDTKGLTNADIEELRRQVEYMRWKNGGNV